MIRSATGHLSSSSTGSSILCYLSAFHIHLKPVHCRTTLQSAVAIRRTAFNYRLPYLHDRLRAVSELRGPFRIWESSSRSLGYLVVCGEERSKRLSTSNRTLSDIPQRLGSDCTRSPTTLLSGEPSRLPHICGRINCDEVEMGARAYIYSSVSRDIT
ncbi:hypothetical protein BKA64DRAFT_207763 [Cadophora sp. MPI-SDFR-AT-0126]|nr:hypothetical protein BKA64DRAFT_207763 [Leotiomycetes sp. MPI-SDFR-AT-0126]